MKKIIFLLVVSVTCFAVLPADAQLNRRAVKKNNRNMSKFHGKKNTFTKQKKYNYIAFSVNALNYFGDIAPKSSIMSTKMSFTRPGVTASFGHRFGPRYTLRTSLSYGVLRSDDYVVNTTAESSFRWVRNAHFRNTILELSSIAVFDLFKNEGSYLSRSVITPYAMIGAAIFHHNPQAIAPETFEGNGANINEAGSWVDLEPLGTEGQYSNLPGTSANVGNDPYSLWQIAIPFGLGVRYKLADALDLSFDISFRYLFTDYIDDISKNYVNPWDLNSDLARAMADRTLEPTSATTGETRDLSGVARTTITDPNTGDIYTVVPGYGHEDGMGTNVRGGRYDNDIYYVTSIRVAYILGASFRRAKFR